MQTSELTKKFFIATNFDLNLTPYDLEGCIEYDYPPEQLFEDAKEQIDGMIFEIELEEEDATDIDVIDEKLSSLINRQIDWEVGNVYWKEVEGEEN